MDLTVTDSPFIEIKDGQDPVVSFYFTDCVIEDDDVENTVLQWAELCCTGNSENTLSIECKIKDLLEFPMEGHALINNKGYYDVDSKDDFMKIRADLQFLIDKIDAMKFA